MWLATIILLGLSGCRIVESAQLRDSTEQSSPFELIINREQWEFKTSDTNMVVLFAGLPVKTESEIAVRGQKLIVPILDDFHFFNKSTKTWTALGYKTNKVNLTSLRGTDYTLKYFCDEAKGTYKDETCTCGDQSKRVTEEQFFTLLTDAAKDDQFVAGDIGVCQTKKLPSPLSDSDPELD